MIPNGCRWGHGHARPAALITRPAGRNTYGGTTMAKPNPDAEGLGGPRIRPEPPEQTQHAGGTGGQAAKNS